MMENGTWAPTAAKVMAKTLEGCKNLTWAEPTVTIRSTLNEESTLALNTLAQTLSEGYAR